MNTYRKKIDDTILNQLKNDIYNYLSSQGIKNPKFFLNNMNNIEGLYVENLLERAIGAMVSRKNEIAIDKMFCDIDRNGNVKFKEEMAKIIKSQLTHELIHSAARYKDAKGEYYTGINKNSDSTALNEGFTQMITERITGFTLSPNNDFYRDLKKFAKILGDTLGDKVVLNTYFNRTADLQKGCEILSGKSDFYDRLNMHMSFMHKMGRNIDKQYHGGIKQKQYDEMKKLIIKELCVNIIVPKLKTLSEKEQKQYIGSILEDVKDDAEFSKMLQNGIVNFYNMDEQTFNYRKQRLNERLEEKEKALETTNLFSNISIEQLAKVIKFDNDGTMNLYKFYKIDNNHQISGEFLAKIIGENESIRELFFATRYESTLKNRQAFENQVEQIMRNDTNLPLGNGTALRKMEIMSAIKIQAKKSGYCILNSIDECKNRNSINMDIFEIPKRGEQYGFQNLKKLYERFEVKAIDDFELGDTTCIIDRKTGKEILNTNLQKAVKFANLWVRSTGVKADSQDKYPGEKYAFNEQSEQIYNMLTKSITSQMVQNGQIDSKGIFELIKSYPYKYSEQIGEGLLKNEEDLSIIHNFFEQLTPEKTLEAEMPKTINETVLGKNYSDRAFLQAESIVNTFSRREIEQKCKTESIGRNEILDLYNNIKNNIRTKIQGKDKENIDRMGN